MAKKYLKNSEGTVRAITSDNLGLEKPLANENYDIEVHNRNMDKIDNAIQEVKGKVDGLELTAQRVSIADSANKFEATNVEDALKEVKTKVDNGQVHKLTWDGGNSIVVDSGTFDDIKTTGIYTCYSNVGGAKPNPSYNGYYHLEVIGADSHLGENNKWITQRATIFEGTGHGIQVYTRICQNGVWTHWGRNAIDGQNHKLTHDDGTCVNITSQNLNNIVKTGKYVGHTLGNAPYNYWYYVEVLARDTSYIYQKITASNDENITKYERVMRNGTWSNWREL